MFTIKAPKPSEYQQLGRAISSVLEAKHIEAMDRRNVTAYYLGTIAGMSLPVTDGDYKAISNHYRTTHLPVLKDWLGRICEAVPIDIDLALIAAFNRYCVRCSVAYPQRVTLSLEGTDEGYSNGMTEQLGLFRNILRRYPQLHENGVAWELRSLITQEG